MPAGEIIALKNNERASKIKDRQCQSYQIVCMCKNKNANKCSVSKIIGLSVANTNVIV